MRRAAVTLLAAAALYEATARSGLFPSALLPTLPAVARTLVATTLDGTMPLHALHTLTRVAVGLAFAVAAGLPLGILMGRFTAVEGFVLPLASALMPIPSLWGHTAGAASNPADAKFLNENIGRFLSPGH